MSNTTNSLSEIELSGTAPSTKSQQEIWLAMQLGGENANLAYNECVSLEISGRIDPELLSGAWDLLVERHESMRTCFTPDGLTLCIERRPRAELRLLD